MTQQVLSISFHLWIPRRTISGFPTGGAGLLNRSQGSLTLLLEFEPRRRGIPGIERYGESVLVQRFFHRVVDLLFRGQLHRWVQWTEKSMLEFSRKALTFYTIREPSRKMATVCFTKSSTGSFMGSYDLDRPVVYQKGARFSFTIALYYFWSCRQFIFHSPEGKRWPRVSWL